MPEQPPENAPELPDRAQYGRNVVHVPASEAVKPCPFPCDCCRWAGRQ